MEIIYEGKDISDYVEVRECGVRDGCGKRCDGLEIVFENADDWYRWGPKQDDTIEVVHRGYSTGKLYLHTVLPENRSYRVLAAGLPCAARQKACRSYAGKTAEEILRSCARASGMGYLHFGLEKDAVIPYIQQNEESAAAFLERVLTLEGAVLKCSNGVYVAIGILYAQARNAHQTIEINALQSGVEYINSGEKLSTLTVQTPYASARATDIDAPGRPELTTGMHPALTELQAGRWARALLLQHNRRCESLILQTEFNPGMTAMTRIDIVGETSAAGEWLIEEVEHDFINNRSRTTMHRCVTGIR